MLGGKERRLMRKYAFEMAFHVQGLGCIPHLKMQASGSNIYSIPPDWKLECAGYSVANMAIPRGSFSCLFSRKPDFAESGREKRK